MRQLSQRLKAKEKAEWTRTNWIAYHVMKFSMAAPDHPPTFEEFDR